MSTAQLGADSHTALIETWPLNATLAAVYVLAMGAYLMSADGWVDYTGHLVGRDFGNFWSVGRHVASGDVVDVFDHRSFSELRERLREQGAAVVGRLQVRTAESGPFVGASPRRGRSRWRARCGRPAGRRRRGPARRVRAQLRPVRRCRHHHRQRGARRQLPRDVDHHGLDRLGAACRASSGPPRDAAFQAATCTRRSW